MRQSHFRPKTPKVKSVPTSLTCRSLPLAEPEISAKAIYWRTLWRSPLPGAGQSLGLRWCIRATLAAFGHLVVQVEGAERLVGSTGPVIFVANHTTRLEALVLPALLMSLRRGRPVHFLADWNLLLVPGLAFVLRCGQTIPVNRKPAKPAWLNRLRPLLCPAQSAHELALARLNAGAAVGIFPEGTATGLPERLLRGLTGAARLSLAAGVPVIPIGIRHRLQPGRHRITNHTPMSLHVGTPLYPSLNQSSEDRSAILAWHGEIMESVASLSAKSWRSNNPRTKHANQV